MEMAQANGHHRRGSDSWRCTDRVRCEFTVDSSAPVFWFSSVFPVSPLAFQAAEPEPPEPKAKEAPPAAAAPAKAPPVEVPPMGDGDQTLNSDIYGLWETLGI